MKRLFLLIVMLFFIKSYSQHLIINNGINYSSLNNDRGILNQNISTYYFGIGLNSLEKSDRKYYLSTEVGVLSKGGQEKSWYDESFGIVEPRDTWRYIFLKPSFRYKLPFDSSHIFLV